VPDRRPEAAVGSAGSVQRRLLRELPDLKVGIAGSVLTGLLATAAVVAQARAVANLVASAMPGGQHRDRLHWFVVLAAGVAGRAFTSLAGELSASWGAARAKAGLRARLVLAAVDRTPSYGWSGSPPPGGARLGAQAPRGPGEPNAPGEIATLAGRGLDALDVYIGRCLPDTVLAVAAPVALLATVGVIDWLSALVMAVVVALFPIFGVLVGRASAALAATRWAQVQRMGALVADLFDGLPVLRAFGRTESVRARLVGINEALGRSSTRALRVAFLSALVLDTLGSVSVALVAVPLGLRLLSGSVSLPAALAVLVVAPEVFLPLRRARAEFHESSEGLAAAAGVLALITGPGALGPSERPGRRPPDPRQNTVELRSVTISLPGQGATVLDRASLSIAPGEKVVLVGPSGAGKSTVVSLLLGFAHPASGTVSVGSEDLATLSIDQWHRYITYLPDHPALLADSLAANLRLAEPGASDADVARALDEACAHDLVAEMASGLGTLLGDGGRPLSAGELQRIALARVLLRSRSLYLLDEPTVHLDVASEARVLEALERALGGRSALIISHRPAVQSIADRVVALEGGKFVTLRRRSPAWAR
jgi:ATP-binding cassette subfamily C protein CydD